LVFTVILTVPGLAGSGPLEAREGAPGKLQATRIPKENRRINTILKAFIVQIYLGEG
jgi:hypothetical protein